MYPLIQIGPFNLSSGGLLLLMSLILGSSVLSRVARARGGTELVRQLDSCFYPVSIGAMIGARLWYGLFNLDLYGRNLALFVALRMSDFAWPGALLGGMLVGCLWCRWRGFDTLALAESTALTLPLIQALTSLGLLLSGEAFGVPTDLPWGVPLFGTTRHPTQLYFMLAALLSFGALRWLDRWAAPRGALLAGYLGTQGLTLLLIEALRADSLLLPGGIRAAQVFGLVLLLYAVYWGRQDARMVATTPAPTVAAETSSADVADAPFP